MFEKNNIIQDDYEIFLERKLIKPLYDIYACFQPFNEATKALFPFFKLLKKNISSDSTILVLWDRTGWVSSLISAIFPRNKILTTWEGDKDILGFKGFDFWFGKEKNIDITFCDLNKPIPFEDNKFGMVVGFDVLHRFDTMILAKELFRVIKADGAIIFPHVHLANSQPNPYFERGENIIHGRDYEKIFQKLCADSEHQCFIFSEPKLFEFNDKEDERLDLISEPDTSDYNSLIAILPQKWRTELLEPFNLKDLEFPEKSRILTNPLLDINLNNQVVKLNRDKLCGQVGYLLERHPVYLKRIEKTDNYQLDEISGKILYWSERFLTLAEIAEKTECFIDEIMKICIKLEDKGIIMVLPVSENGLRLQSFISTQKYITPYFEQNLRALWQTSVERYKNDILIFNESEQSSLTYGECNEITKNIMAGLEHSGLKKGDRIAIFSPLNFEAVLTVWACMQIGIVVIPVSYQIPENIVKHLISISDVKMVFASNHTYQSAKRFFSGINTIIFDDIESQSEHAYQYFSDWIIPVDEFTFKHDLDHQDEAIVLLTSGSTGIPKLVSLSQGNLFRSGKIIAENFQWEKSDRYFAFAGLETMSGLRNTCISPLIYGTSIIISNSELKQNTFSLAEAVLSSKATIISTNPVLLRQFVTHHNRIGNYLASLRLVMCTGSELTDELRKEFFKKYKLKIVNYYGLTETTGVCISQNPEEQLTSENIGSPIGCIAQTVDENGNIIQDGQKGELRIYSENLMQGYLCEPGLTKELIIDKWLYTGDIACSTNEGKIQLLGRKREIIKTASGDLVFLKEVVDFIKKIAEIYDAVVYSYKENDNEKMIAFIISKNFIKDEKSFINKIKNDIIENLGISHLPSIFKLKKGFPHNDAGKVIKEKLMNGL